MDELLKAIDRVSSHPLSIRGQELFARRIALLAFEAAAREVDPVGKAFTADMQGSARAIVRGECARMIRALSARLGE
jgi:hypothetical protein